MTILTAKVAPVNLGLLTIEGVMDENGKYYVAVPQICDLFRLAKDHAARDIKGLLGGNPREATTNLRILGEQNRNYTVCVNLKNFRKVTMKLALRENAFAKPMAEMLLDLILDELFNDAFGISNSSESRQEFLREWQATRQRLRDVHPGMQQAALRRHHPAAAVHDLMTKLICGNTAEEARMNELVDPDADPTIGLNYREEIDGMLKLIKAKQAYAYMRKPGTWQEQVERAVEKV